MSEEKSKKQLLRCSFCGKSEKETHRMIQGPAGVRICDECVRLCMEIVEDGYEAEQHEFDTPDEIPTPHECPPAKAPGPRPPPGESPGPSDAPAPDAPVPQASPPAWFCEAEHGPE